MSRYYSRISSVEEKRNLKRAVFFIVLSLSVFLLFFFFGLPLTAKFVGFVTDLGKTNKPIDKQDTIPPAPPRVDLLPEATNKTVLDISGSAESGATVVLTYNGKTEESVSSSDSKFTFSVPLNKGDNTFSIKAKDPAGNESLETDLPAVLFDNEEPKLEITSPADKSEFFGDKQKQVTIKGLTDAKASVTINERQAGVDDSGNFSLTLTLSEGENSFTIKAVDQAQNTSEKSLTLKYSP